VEAVPALWVEALRVPIRKISKSEIAANRVVLNRIW